MHCFTTLWNTLIAVAYFFACFTGDLNRWLFHESRYLSSIHDTTCFTRLICLSLVIIVTSTLLFIALITDINYDENTNTRYPLRRFRLGWDAE